MLWKRWVAVGVLAGLTAGAVVMSRVPAGEAAPGESHRITIPAAAFIATDDDSEFSNNGNFVAALGGTVYFSAPVFFPVDLDHVRIIRLTLWAEDDGAGEVCATLYRARPKGGAGDGMGYVCSSGAAAGARAFRTRALTPRRADPREAFYLWVDVPPGSNHSLYGVSIDWREI